MRGPESRRRQGLEIVAGALVVVPLVLVDVVFGAVAGVGLVAARALGGRLFAFAVAQLVLAVVATRAGTLVPLLVAQFGALLVLFVPPTDGGDDLRYVGATAGGLLALGGLAFLGVQATGRPWVGAALIAGAAGLVAAGLYRYELVLTGVGASE